MLLNNSCRSVLTSLFIAMSAAACAVLPYEDDFACKNEDFGQCIHPENAYRDAVGATVGSDASRGNVSANPKRREARKYQANHGYDGYQDAVYRQLASIVDAPVTPMIAPAKTVRTLILPYADKDGAGRLYMPRFVYSVLEQPRFVLGDYLSRPENDFAGAIARGIMIPPPRRSGSPPDLPPEITGDENISLTSGPGGE